MSYTRKRKILFLLMGKDVPSSKYRIFTYLPLLEKNGFHIEIVAGGTGFNKKLDILANAEVVDVVFIQKKLFSNFYLRQLRRKSKKMVFDFDDALFAREPTAKLFSLKKPGSRLTRNRLNCVLNIVDQVIAGNDYLASYARWFSNNVRILPTPIQLNDYSDELRKQAPVSIGWIGTGRNLIYLRRIETVIREIYAKYPEIEWCVISDSDFFIEGVPIRNIPWDDKTALLEMGRFHIGIMPLWDDEWGRGKCAFKLLQYMASGVAPVASPAGMNCKVISHGETGFLASSEGEWITFISSLIENSDLRKRIASQAREFVMKNYSVERWWPSLREIVGS